MVSISADMTVAIWEVTTSQQLSVIYMPVEPISLDVSKSGSVMFIGTAAGTFRIYDITDRENPRLIQQLKFYEDEKPVSQILSSDDGKLVLISSVRSETFYVMSQESSNNFDIYGKISGNGYILSMGYHKKDGKDVALAVLSNNLVECYELPTKVYEDRLNSMPAEATKQCVRKIDVGSDMIICNSFMKQYLVTGDDNVLKVYEHYPSDSFDKIDWRKPAVKPAIEHNDNHSIASTVVACCANTKTIVTGGRDGMVNIRSSEKQMGYDNPFECLNTFSAHAVINGGVQCIALDQAGQFIYTAAGDGSIVIFSVGNVALPRSPVQDDLDSEKSALSRIPEAMA